MDPENRLMARVSVDDAAEADKILICLWEIRLNHVVSSLKKMRFTVRLIFNRILT